ncbi:TPA: thiopurine S-methyltransferase [Streptococcus suis]
MGFFQNDNEQRTAKRVAAGNKAVDSVNVFIEYHDQGVEQINIERNLDELLNLFSVAMQSGSGITFSGLTPAKVINPRYIKKVSFSKVNP